MDLHEVSELWNIIHFPTSTTIDMVKSLLFHQRSYSPDTRTRYFNDSYNTVGLQQQSHSRSDIADNFNKSVNRANQIIQFCRANPRPTRPPQHFDTDFVPLPHSLDDEYNVHDDDDVHDNYDDSSGSNHSHDSVSRVCPPTLQEMLVIVADTRRRIENNKKKLLQRRRNRASVTASAPFHNTSCYSSSHIATSSSSSSALRHLSVNDINALFSSTHESPPGSPTISEAEHIFRYGGED
jgi:hypothetical protein